MIEIKIADMTLRESEQVYEARLSFKEKLETAKLLEKLHVDVIETAPTSGSPADLAFIRTLAATLEYSALCVPVLQFDRQTVKKTWEALSRAKKPRLNVAAPTSTVQMEYRRQTKAEALLPLVSEITAFCSELCQDVEFTAIDAVRAEPEFLSALIKAAVKAGAQTVNLCDSVGELLPDELSRFIAAVYASTPELGNVTLALHCRDNLGLASAAALAGINSGARMIKVSSAAKSNTLSLGQFLNVIKVRGETLGVSYNINDTSLRRTCSQIAALSGAGVALREDAENAEEKAGEGGLPGDADIGALRTHIETLGYEISEDDLELIYAQFQEIARSKQVVDRDIEALIAETAGQAASAYQLSNYVINSGSAITATAFLEIIKDGVPQKALSDGDGPIAAAFKAAEQVLGSHYELEEFQIWAVTGGREATGDALVKLRHGGKLYSGRGVSTDIVGAGIRAYLSAANKIVHDERSNTDQ